MRQIRALIGAFKFLLHVKALRKPSIFNNLDEDLLRKIYEQLPLVDQACLSLSCKRFFYLFFGTIVKREEFFFPRLLHIKIPKLCVNRSEALRNQLLVRLENGRWAFCGSCLKLHPRKEFSKASLEVPSLQRRCAAYSGIADLCPCISLTLRDRARIIKLLKSPLPVKTTKDRIDVYGSFDILFDPRGRPFLLHDCSPDTNSDNELTIKMVLFIESDQLMMQALYTLYVFSPQATLEPIFLCLHRDLLFLFRINAIPGICDVCGIQVEWWPHTSKPTNPISVDLTRALGRCVWHADYQWLKQCRFTGNLYWAYGSYWFQSSAIKEEQRLGWPQTSLG